MKVTETVAAPGEHPDVVLTMAGALEDGSEHPIGRAVVAAARAAAGPLPSVTGFASVQGCGVQAAVDGEPAIPGRPSWLAESGFPGPDELLNPQPPRGGPRPPPASL